MVRLRDGLIEGFVLVLTHHAKTGGGARAKSNTDDAPVVLRGGIRIGVVILSFCFRLLLRKHY